MKALSGFLVIIFGVLAGSLGEATPSDNVSIGFLSASSLSFDIAEVDNYETVFVVKQIAQSLLDEDNAGSIIPSIARFWTISLDQRVYTFTLNEKIYFHDGTPLTAEDVRYSLAVIKNSHTNPASFYLNRIQNIEVPDSRTVKITLDSPWYGFLYCLSSGLIPIFSKESYERDRSFQSTGPYIKKLIQGRWYFQKHDTYRGPYAPEIDQFEILIRGKDKSQPDILINDIAHFPSFSAYQKAEIDSFNAFSFMINASKQQWQDHTQRLALVKALLEAKDIVKSPRLKDLRDILPKGMIGYDIRGSAFEKLLAELRTIDDLTLKTKTIKIGSAGPIMNFKALAILLKKKYGINAINIAFPVPKYLETMKNDRDIDVYTVGWGSIFNHPDATLIPYYILGIQKSSTELESLIKQIQYSTELAVQFDIYRQFTTKAITGGYIVPHSQIQVGMYVKDTVVVPNYRYRYTLQLSEIKRKGSL